jgi:Flp pilus assembly protein TadD
MSVADSATDVAAAEIAEAFAKENYRKAVSRLKKGGRSRPADALRSTRQLGFPGRR